MRTKIERTTAQKAERTEMLVNQIKKLWGEDYHTVTLDIHNIDLDALEATGKYELVEFPSSEGGPFRTATPKAADDYRVIYFGK